jgi:hypothetical protein
MSDTKIDYAKITQMLDAGWQILLYRGVMGSYEVRATHERDNMVPRVIERLRSNWPDDAPTQYDEDFDLDNDGSLMTDDFSPEQALTRMAYKIFGEVI